MSSHSVVIHLHSIACKGLCESIMIGNNSCSLPLQVVLQPTCSMLLAAQLVCGQDSRFLVLLPCKQSCVCVMCVSCVCVMCVCHACVCEHKDSSYQLEGMVHTACPSSHLLMWLTRDQLSAWHDELDSVRNMRL